MNDENFIAKCFRFAERMGEQTGVKDLVAEFDANSAAFPNPSPLVCAT